MLFNDFYIINACFSCSNEQVFQNRTDFIINAACSDDSCPALTTLKFSFGIPTA